MDCKCGNQACAIRESRGLKPFCRIEASKPQPRKTPCAACLENAGKLFGAKHGVIRCAHAGKAVV